MHGGELEDVGNKEQLLIVAEHMEQLVDPSLEEKLEEVVHRQQKHVHHTHSGTCSPRDGTNASPPSRADLTTRTDLVKDEIAWGTSKGCEAEENPNLSRVLDNRLEIHTSGSMRDSSLSSLNFPIHSCNFSDRVGISPTVSTF